MNNKHNCWNKCIQRVKILTNSRHTTKKIRATKSSSYSFMVQFMMHEQKEEGMYLWNSLGSMQEINLKIITCFDNESCT
jgi:hypothetical protein